MLKYFLICAAAVMLSFLSAGLLSHISVGPSWLWKRGRDREVRYRFYLGCALFLALGICGAVAAAARYAIIALLAFGVAVAGAGMAVFCLARICESYAKLLRSAETETGHVSDDPIGDGETDGLPRETECVERVQAVAVNGCDGSGASDQSAIGGDGHGGEVFGGKIADKSATNDRKFDLAARIVGLLVDKPRTKAIIWGVIFAVCLVAFLVLAASPFSQIADSGADAEESSVVFETAERAGDTVLFKANGGADTYAVFGYCAELDSVGELIEKVNGETVFTVRYAVMDEDRWSGYYLLLEVSDGDGVSYLSEAEVLAARAGAVNGKNVIFGMLSLLSGGIFGLYAVLAVRKRSSIKEADGPSA